jgi:hypothetical protein
MRCQTNPEMPTERGVRQPGIAAKPLVLLPALPPAASSRSVTVFQAGSGARLASRLATVANPGRTWSNRSCACPLPRARLELRCKQHSPDATPASPLQNAHLRVTLPPPHVIRRRLPLQSEARLPHCGRKRPIYPGACSAALDADDRLSNPSDGASRFSIGLTCRTHAVCALRLQRAPRPRAPNLGPAVRGACHGVCRRHSPGSLPSPGHESDAPNLTPSAADDPLKGSP